MSKRRFSTTALAVVLSLTFAAAPVMANPGNGNGGGHGNGGGQGNGGNHGNGNSGNHGNKQNSGQDNPGKSDKSFKSSKDVGNDVDARVSFDHARHLALNYGLTGYESLPPGIAKKTVPASMLGQLPSYPGYEWRVVGDDLVLIALSTAIVTSVINGVFK